jgi:hypothetical protein
MGSYTVERSTTVDASPEQVHDLVDDFHQWVSWSPWEGLDPDLQRTYSGPDRGVGAQYEWSGNRKAGEGSMRITGSTPQAVDVDLTFRKPFPSTSRVRFELTPSGAGTAVTWRMSGEQTGLMGVIGKVVKMDRLIGPDFEKGLARLKAVAEEAR